MMNLRLVAIALALCAFSSPVLSQFTVTNGQRQVANLADGATFNMVLPGFWTTIDVRLSVLDDSQVTIVYSTANLGALMTPHNPTYTISDPTADLQAFQLVSPAAGELPEDTLTVTISSTNMDHTEVGVSITARAGECASYVDCFRHEDDHPSTRAANSPNTINRFRHCMLLPTAAEPTKPFTRCVECLSDCDCAGDQYCHRDAGVCDMGGNNYYTCDSESQRFLGICRKKDPTGDIINKACRSTQIVEGADPPAMSIAKTYKDGLTAAEGLVLGSAPETLPLYSEGASFDRLATGAKFCGLARYYNSSTNDAGSDISRANGARAVLWQGYCVMGVCHDCLGDRSMCGGAQQCIQGEREQTIVVDGTIRTFTKNTVAGVMLAVLFMVVLVQLCLACQIFQLHHYRKKDQALANPQEEKKIIF